MSIEGLEMRLECIEINQVNIINQLGKVLAYLSYLEQDRNHHETTEETSGSP